MKKDKFVPLTVEAGDDRMVYALAEMKRLEEENAVLRAEVERLRDALDQIRLMHRLNDPNPKETALRMCAEAEEALVALKGGG